MFRAAVPEPYKTKIQTAQAELCSSSQQQGNRGSKSNKKMQITPGYRSGAHPLEEQAAALELEAQQLEEHADALEKIVE